MNLLADTLSQKAEDLQTQKEVKQKNQIKTLLSIEHIIASVKVNLQAELDMVNRILTANRDSDSLQAYKEKAQHKDPHWMITNHELLLFDGRLIIPEEGTLYTELLQNIHKDPSYAHSGRTKFWKLVKDYYYWPGLIMIVDQYQKNCHKCVQSSHPYDKTPGWLHSLAIGDRP